MVGLIQRFEEVVAEEKAERDAIRMLQGKFDMNDFLEQIGVLEKMVFFLEPRSTTASWCASPP